MSENNVVALRQPGEIHDPLTEVLRNGARKLLAQAIEAEVDALLAERRHLRLKDGRQRLVHHGHGPARTVLTGIGPVTLQRAKVRDHGGDGDNRVRSTSAILPKFGHQARSVDAVLPKHYLCGLSSGDFQEALQALLGSEASGLSAQAISRLKAEWKTERNGGAVATCRPGGITTFGRAASTCKARCKTKNSASWC